MNFVVVRLFKFGLSQAKKHKAKKEPQQQEHYFPRSKDAPPFRRSNNAEIMNPNIIGGPFSSAKALIESIIRFFQLVFGLVVIGLYGQDLNTAREAKVYADPKWVYAVVTSALAAITALVYLVSLFVVKERALTARPRLHLPLFLWECVLCILWLTLFGIFGKMFISERAEGDTDIDRMKNAVWIDLTNLGMWVITGLWAGFRWWKSKRGPQMGSDGPVDDPEKVEMVV